MGFQTLWPYSLKKPDFTDFGCSSGQVLSKTKLVTPHFFYISDITNSSSLNCKIPWKKPILEKFGTNVLKVAPYSFLTNWFRNRAMAQALKNLCVSRAQHQPPRVTRTGRILATIVAHFQCVSHPWSNFSLI